MLFRSSQSDLLANPNPRRSPGIFSKRNQQLALMLAIGVGICYPPVVYYHRVYHKPGQLARILTSGDYTKKQKAILDVHKLGKKAGVAITQLAFIAEHDDKEVLRAQAIQALGRITVETKSEKYLTVLLNRLKFDESFHVRRWTIVTLKGIALSDPSTSDRIYDLFQKSLNKEKHSMVRGVLTTAIRDIDRRNGIIIPTE